jgi:hypothetical protein
MPEWVSTVAAVLGMAGGAGAAWAIFRERAFKATMDAFRVGNQELRELWEQEKQVRASVEHQCRLDIARLEGQIEVLQGTLIQGLVTQIESRLVDAIHTVINQPDRRG